MDFYNLQESDHQLLEKTMDLTVGSREYRDYLRKQFFNLEKLSDKKCIMVAEEDPRVQRVMQTLIREENRGAQCLFADSIDEIQGLLKENSNCDLLVANYYTAEDEIDYEFWEMIRQEYPHMEVVILSHVNDREYYEMLEKIQDDELAHGLGSSSKIKQFLDSVFGGWYGNH